MATYSIATAKDQLSRLMDEALAGETVVIDRDGASAVELRPRIQRVRPRTITQADIDWLRVRRAEIPSSDESAADVIRKMRDEEE